MRDRAEFEIILLAGLKQYKSELDAMLQEMSAHWTYEDPFYRFYHQSFKVFGIQQTTERAVTLLRKLVPGRELNSTFLRIMAQGTGRNFDVSDNKDWENRTRPLLEAFAHAKYMIEMAVRYSDLAAPPNPMPSGYAGLLYLFDLR